MTIELSSLIKQLENRSYGDNTIPNVIGYLKTLEKQLRLVSDVSSLKDVQGHCGTWDSDDYMRGLFNGLELASATLEQREPKFKPVFTDIEKKDQEIETLKRCLFQMQEATKELLNITDRQSKIIGTPQKVKKPIQDSDIATEYIEERGRIFKDKYGPKMGWRGLTEKEILNIDYNGSRLDFVREIEAKLKELNK